MQNEKITKNLERALYQLGVDRHNTYGIVTARSMGYPYLNNINAKTAYFAGINSANKRYFREDVNVYDKVTQHCA